MTEMRNVTPTTTQPDEAVVVDDLVAEAGDDTIRAVLNAARATWLSAEEPAPTDELRAFMATATRSSHPGGTAAGKRWVTPWLDTVRGLWPPSGRLAFGVALVAVVTIVAAATVGLEGPDPDRIGSAANGSIDGSSSTTRTTGTTAAEATASTSTSSSTSTSDSPTALSDLPSARIAVADAGTADIAVVGGLPVLVAADPAPGWRVVHEPPDEPHEIDLSYRRGDDRVDLDVEIDDGRIRVRIRDRRTETETESFFGPEGESAEPEDREDNSGPGNAEDREDNSGPGNAEDPEDNSGPGNAEDRGD